MTLLVVLVHRISAISSSRVVLGKRAVHPSLALAFSFFSSQSQHYYDITRVEYEPTEHFISFHLTRFPTGNVEALVALTLQIAMD